MSERKITPREYCEAFYTGLRILEEAEIITPDTRLDGVRLAIEKSCLLDRLIYGGEKPSTVKCPVHAGKWSGMHLWGTREIDGRWFTEWTGVGGTRVGDPESETLAKWRAAGCRCFMHSCGCTTGWQPEVIVTPVYRALEG